MTRLVLLALVLSSCSQTLLCWTQQGHTLEVTGMNTERHVGLALRVERTETYCVISPYRSWRLR